MKNLINMKIHIHLLLTLSTIPIVFSLSLYNYCTIPSCAPGTHTFCIHGFRSVATERCGHIIRSNLTTGERESILNMHNYFRETVYSGAEERGYFGPQPAAADITLLEWDRELELAAQVWAQQCPAGIDECRNVERFHVNQNMGRKLSRESINELSIEGILWDWYNEVRRFNAAEVSLYSNQRADFWLTHHYTQIVWESTTKIGCGQMLNRDANVYRLTLVCNYGPAGNIPGQPIYTIRNESENYKR